MARSLTVVVGHEEKRKRIMASFARLLLLCKHQFDVSGSDQAEIVMAARREGYIEVLWAFPIHVIESAATTCASAKSGWFPSTGEWAESCRAELERQLREARQAEDSLRTAGLPKLSQAERLANLERVLDIVRNTVKPIPGRR